MGESSWDYLMDGLISPELLKTVKGKEENEKCFQREIKHGWQFPEQIDRTDNPCGREDSYCQQTSAKQKCHQNPVIGVSVRYFPAQIVSDCNTC